MGILNICKYTMSVTYSTLQVDTFILPAYCSQYNSLLLVWLSFQKIKILSAETDCLWVKIAKNQNVSSMNFRKFL